MNSTITSIILLASLVTVVLLGQRLQRGLPDHHLSVDSKDAVKLAIGLVATMTALLLGLLAFSAKGTYDTRRTEIIEIAAKVTFLNREKWTFLRHRAVPQVKFYFSSLPELRPVLAAISGAARPAADRLNGNPRQQP